MLKENILSELIENIKDEKFIKIVFSDKQNEDFNKIIIKPLLLKSEKNIQIESFKENKAFHKNIELNNIQEIENILKKYIKNFKQILLQIENLDISFIKKKENFVKKENKNNLIKNSNKHNKKKQYILNEGNKIDFLIELGLMSVEGKILKSSYNKLAQKLNYNNLEFLNGNIKDYDKAKEVDLVFSLHACNNATDYSLEKALSLNAKAILAVPCCHHEFFEKIQKNKNSNFYSTLKIMADNGVVLDKFATLATDSFRSLTLELCGYKTKMIEFIDTEHTPKNILIRAIKSKSSNLKEKLKEYNKLKRFLGIKPLLEDLTKKYFLIDTNIEIPYN